MQEFRGKTIHKGIAIGKVFYYSPDCGAVKKEQISDAAAEIARFAQAVEVAGQQIQKLCEKASADMDSSSAMIFEIHGMLLEDRGFQDAILSMIEKSKVNAEYAVEYVGKNLANMFAGMDDEAFRARAADMNDITRRLLGILLKTDADITVPEEPFILVAEDLTPGEAVRLETPNLRAIVTGKGSAYSHTAVLAGAMGIPYLTGVKADSACNGKTAVADGDQGVFITDPDEDILCMYREKISRLAEAESRLEALKDLEDRTESGKIIALYANAGSVADVEKAVENGASGIGLFRTEFLFLQRNNYPTEEEQFAVYKAAVQKAEGRKVIFRTMDIGADKCADYLELPKEDNPALGYRGVRFCLDRPDVFKTQMRALYRASAFGTVAIMIPMITSLKEVKECKRICKEVRDALSAEKIPYANAQFGIMIETPAAVMLSDILAEEVDFFSIGTNDLTQYTLAADRQNPRVAGIYDAGSEAVMRMIQTVIDNGHARGCKVGICGELAADTALTGKLIRMGIDELSVSPAYVLSVREAVRNS